MRTVSGGISAQAAAVSPDAPGVGFGEKLRDVHADAKGGRTDDGPNRLSRVGRRAESGKVGVLVGANDPFTRQALRRGASSRGVEVLAAGTVTAVAGQLAAELRPHVVVLDVQTAAAQGLRAIQQIRASAPGTRILACCAPAGTEFGLLCLSVGAWGYVSKEIDLAALPGILCALARGEVIIPDALATELVRRFARASAGERLEPSELSQPECRLLELLRTGSSLSAAATELGVTLGTARRHLGSARRKLSVPPPASDPSARGPMD